ncbi:hypothetical protein K438DRAFT_1779225 [Mycena galopus ATCC 62051]|nr:hypothetical protein K438DRAFT_1779225 [Mycena galopus ATCC 62051]
MSTDGDPYTYGTIRRASGARRSVEASVERSGPSRQNLSNFAKIRLDTDRTTYTYGSSACTEGGSRCCDPERSLLILVPALAVLLKDFEMGFNGPGNEFVLLRATLLNLTKLKGPGSPFVKINEWGIQ